MKKYEMILQDLEKKIFDKTYRENELLPSEHQMCESYGASRATVRQALKILEESGVIVRKHGLGSIVISHEKLLFPVSNLSSFREVQEALGFDYLTEIVKFELVDVDLALSNLTHFPVGQKAYHILRRRQIEGNYSILDRDYIQQSIVPEMSEADIQFSLYDYLEGKLNLDIAYAHKEITIDFISQEDKDLIDLHPMDRHVVSVKSHVYLSNNSPFQYTESRHQVDKFRFNEFAQRKAK